SDPWWPADRLPLVADQQPALVLDTLVVDAHLGVADDHRPRHHPSAEAHDPRHLAAPDGHPGTAVLHQPENFIHRLSVARALFSGEDLDGSAERYLMDQVGDAVVAQPDASMADVLAQ